VVDYAWVTREELSQYFATTVHDAVKDLLPPF